MPPFGAVEVGVTTTVRSEEYESPETAVRSMLAPVSVPRSDGITTDAPPSSVRPDSVTVKAPLPMRAMLMRPRLFTELNAPPMSSLPL